MSVDALLASDISVQCGLFYLFIWFYVCCVFKEFCEIDNVRYSVATWHKWKKREVVLLCIYMFSFFKHPNVAVTNELSVLTTYNYLPTYRLRFICKFIYKWRFIHIVKWTDDQWEIVCSPLIVPLFKETLSHSDPLLMCKFGSAGCGFEKESVEEWQWRASSCGAGGSSPSGTHCWKLG